jgi:hypothetical protein
MRAVLRTAVVLALGAGLVVGAVRLPDLHARMAGAGSAEPARAAQSPAARAVTRAAVVCPGPESVGVKRIDTTTAVAPSMVRVASPPTDLLSPVLGPGGGSTSASITAKAMSGTALTFEPMSAPGAASVQTSAAQSVLLSGNGSLAPALSATQTSLITNGDLRGLSTVVCQQPSPQTWLVGGAGTAGHRSRVILSNPTPNAVTVNLDVYGAKGEIASTAARGIVVKAGRRAVVLLDSIAHGEASPVVHVMASGGVIAATLNDTWLSSTTPAGSDDAAGTTAGTHLVVPGVTGSTAPGSAVLRVMATDSATTVRLRVLGASGPTAASVANGEVQLAAHTVKDINLTGLPVGYSGLELTSTAPVVAGVRLRNGQPVPGLKRDLAWTAAEPALTPATGLTGVPLGSVTPPWSSGLALTAATEDATVDLVYVGADGSEATQQVTVSAGTTSTIAVPATLAAVPTTPAGASGAPATAPVSVWLRPRTGSVVAALTTHYADPAGGLISVAPLVATPVQFTPVAVHPLSG